MGSFKHKTTGRLSTPETVSLHNLKKNKQQYWLLRSFVCMHAYYILKLILLNKTVGKISIPTVTLLSSPSVLYPCGKQALLFNCIQSNTLLIEYIFSRITLRKLFNSVFHNCFRTTSFYRILDVFSMYIII